MKALALIASVGLLAATLSTPVFAAGDAAAGKTKAAACVACHGNDALPGVFLSLQLAGRNADKLTVKTNKYKTGKIFHPMMNMATAFFSEKDIEDVSAYYQSLGKPLFTAPWLTIKGDE